jgi:hypothetical protein
MMLKINCFDIIHLRIFSFVHSIDFSSWSVWYRNFAMMIFLSFKTHTFRRRQTFFSFLNDLLNIFVSDLKSFFVQSSKSFRNCFHRLVSLKFAWSHLLIIISIKAFLSFSLTSLILIFIAEIRSMRWGLKKDSWEIMRVKIMIFLIF